MATFEILDDLGNVVNTIIADTAFMQLHYPNQYREIPEAVSVVAPTMSKLAFMERFTDAELAGIYSSAKASVPVEVWLEKFKLATDINLGDTRLIAGIHALGDAGLLTTNRVAEILAY